MSQLLLRIPPRNPKECDCGNPGIREDGSGWYCAECEEYLDRMYKLQHQLMMETRAELFFDTRIEGKRNKWQRHAEKKRMAA